MIGLHGMIDAHPDRHRRRLLGQDGDVEIDPVLAIRARLAGSQTRSREAATKPQSRPGETRGASFMQILSAMGL